MTALIGIFSAFGLALLIALTLFALFHNRKMTSIRSTFTNQYDVQNSIVLMNIRTSWFISTAFRLYFSLWNLSDIFVFENHLVLFRRCRFLLPLRYPPIVIVIDPLKSSAALEPAASAARPFVTPLFDTPYQPYELEKVRSHRTGVELILKNKADTSTNTSITLKNLTTHQKNQFINLVPATRHHPQLQTL